MLWPFCVYAGLRAFPVPVALVQLLRDPWPLPPAGSVVACARVRDPSRAFKICPCLLFYFPVRVFLYASWCAFGAFYVAISALYTHFYTLFYSLLPVCVLMFRDLFGILRGSCSFFPNSWICENAHFMRFVARPFRNYSRKNSFAHRTVFRFVARSPYFMRPVGSFRVFLLSSLLDILIIILLICTYCTREFFKYYPALVYYLPGFFAIIIFIIAVIIYYPLVARSDAPIFDFTLLGCIYSPYVL